CDESDGSGYTGSDCDVDIEKTINGGDGLCIPVGTPLTYEFLVTNNGSVPVAYTVTDSDLGEVGSGVLAPNSSDTITVVQGTAQPGPHTDIATINAIDEECEVTCDESDGSGYTGSDCDVDIEKTINGGDGLCIPVGTPLTYEFLVTNNGSVPVAYTVTDSDLGGVGGGVLAPNSSDTITVVQGTAQPGPHTDTATINAVASVPLPIDCEIPCDESDGSGYTGSDCDVDIEKTINGGDGLCIPVGTPLTYEFLVTNNGGVPVAYTVTDSDLGGVGGGVLPPNSSDTITVVQGTAQPGPHTDIATINATDVDCGVTCDESDGSGYTGADCGVRIEKLINGVDIDDCASAPQLSIGDPITWTYEVTNEGQSPLSVVSVVDNPVPASGQPVRGADAPGNNDDVLEPGEKWIYTASGVAQSGSNSNVAIVTAENLCEEICTDDDPSCYEGVGVSEGCTPGYWKNLKKHGWAWSYDPQQTVGSVFGDILDKDETLREALNGGGGSTFEGAFNQLMFHAVAALLNMASPYINYPYPNGIPGLIADVQAVNASGDRDAAIQLKSDLDTRNNAGCTIGNRPPDQEKPDKPNKAPARQMSGEDVLGQNNPNPFNPETWISFKLANGADVKIDIYDITGRLVRTLDVGYRPAGSYWDRSKSAYWDGRNESGEPISSGVYMYRLTAGTFTAMRRMVVLK
ncbi:FlgD immunoglobulin-like domain containing protein, partial [Candidatus Poribacteria bacterium]